MNFNSIITARQNFSGTNQEFVDYYNQTITIKSTAPTRYLGYGTLSIIFSLTRALEIQSFIVAMSESFDMQTRAQGRFINSILESSTGVDLSLDNSILMVEDFASNSVITQEEKDVLLNMGRTIKKRYSDFEMTEDLTLELIERLLKIKNLETEAINQYNNVWDTIQGFKSNNSTVPDHISEI